MFTNHRWLAASRLAKFVSNRLNVPVTIGKGQQIDIFAGAWASPRSWA